MGFRTHCVKCHILANGCFYLVLLCYKQAQFALSDTKHYLQPSLSYTSVIPRKEQLDAFSTVRTDSSQPSLKPLE